RKHHASSDLWEASPTRAWGCLADPGLHGPPSSAALRAPGPGPPQGPREGRGPPRCRGAALPLAAGPSGVVLVYGGMGPSGSLSDVHAYRVVERSWVHCATTGAAPSGRVAPSLALWEGGSQLLVFGGMDDLGFPEELHSLSFEGSDVHSGESLVGHWSVVEVGSTRPSGRYGHTAVFDEASSTMLVFGGSDDHYQALKELWRYDAAAQAWSLLLPSGAAPASRYYHAAAWGPAQEKMFVSGGITGGADLPTEVLGDLWVYDARENSWRELVSSSAGVAAPARWSHTWSSWTPCRRA
ncbi:unnamed protein product, partial [Prorocentrum cordatum]